jgi:signal transduction histidine kinase
MSRTGGRLADRLGELELFDGLSPDLLDWLARIGRRVTLCDGEVLYREGEPAEAFYVLLSGELVITTHVGGHEQVLSRHSRHPGPDWWEPDKPRAANQFTAELPLLTEGLLVATATAAGPSEVIAYTRRAFFNILERCPQIARVLLPVLAWRIRSQQERTGRTVLLDQLGSLAAGLAHELNNPVAAMTRGTAELHRLVDELTQWGTEWGRLATPQEREQLDQVVKLVLHEAPDEGPGSALAAAEAADELQDWLDEHAVGVGSETGMALADLGVHPGLLATLVDVLRPQVLPVALGQLSARLQAMAVISEVSAAGGRIEALVHSMAVFSDLDSSPVREVDIHEGLEAALAVTAPQLAKIRVVREYGLPPRLTARPAELNQVWTSLLQNAVDAMGGEGELHILTRSEGTCVIVEIRDNGPGIPEDVQPQVFQPFFTTRPVGEGAGLGLHLCRDIVANRHAGSIDVQSRPGDTRLIVRLPAKGPLPE